MLNLFNSNQTYLACGSTYLRKSIDGLSIDQPKAHKEVRERSLRLKNKRLITCQGDEILTA